MVSAPSSVSAVCLLRHHLKACVDPSMQHVLLSRQNQLVGVLGSGFMMLPISALWRDDLPSPELLFAWHLARAGGAGGNPSSAFVSQHPVYCLGFWPVLPDALALPPQRQMEEEEETCAQGKCLFLAIRGIPDLHLCFPVPVPCWHQGGNLLWQLVARSPWLAFK